MKATLFQVPGVADVRRPVTVECAACGWEFDAPPPPATRRCPRCKPTTPAEVRDIVMGAREGVDFETMPVRRAAGGR